MHTRCYWLIHLRALTAGAGCIMGYFQRYSYTNVDSVKEYVEAVSNERFPISKLSKSTHEDIVRKVMTKLYLRLPVDRHEFQAHFGKLSEEVFPNQLKRSKEKVVIEMDEKEIRIKGLATSGKQTSHGNSSHAYELNVWLLLLAQDFWNITTCWIRPKDVSGVDFRSGSTSAANLTIFTHATFPFQVASIPKLKREFGCL